MKLNNKGLSNILIIVIAAVSILIILGAVVAYFWFWPGNLKTEEFAFTDFTAAEGSWGFEINIKQSNSFSVVISADEKIFDNIKVIQTENTLMIGFEQGFNPGLLAKKAEITMPDLNKLILSGASKGTAEGFSNSDQFVLGISGASYLEMTNINVGDLDINVSGASRLDARGTGNNLVSLVSGASNIDLSNFVVNNVDIDISGASKATINTAGILDANISGASTLEYLGEPTLGTINTSDSSTIRKK